ncbi:phage holin family protein [Defluviitalea saccharophila]|uniref:Phage holin family protein n=1 Tax=Defluviitalea saccharophila TaxID=879970 RepID=A0ABZ2YAA8_9FIRM|nr:phage holin family protein [Candidatus Epulonipiscium sp.]
MADETTRNRTNNESNFSIGHVLMRLVGTAIVLAITAFFTPGFRITNLWSLIVASIVITAIDYLIERFTGIDASPFGRGVVGFIVSVAIIFFTRYIVSGFDVTLWGAIIGSVVIGIINALTPGRAL